MGIFVVVLTHILMVTMSLKAWVVIITFFPLKMHVIFEIITNVIWRRGSRVQHFKF